MQKPILPTNFYIGVRDSADRCVWLYKRDAHFTTLYCIHLNLITISNICYHAKIDPDDVR